MDGSIKEVCLLSFAFVSRFLRGEETIPICLLVDVRSHCVCLDFQGLLGDRGPPGPQGPKGVEVR